MHQHTQIFHLGFGYPNSGPQAFEEHALPSESVPQFKHWVPNSGLLEEQEVYLTTEPSFQRLVSLSSLSVLFSTYGEGRGICFK